MTTLFVILFGKNPYHYWTQKYRRRIEFIVQNGFDPTMPLENWAGNPTRLGFPANSQELFLVKKLLLIRSGTITPPVRLDSLPSQPVGISCPIPKIIFSHNPNRNHHPARPVGLAPLPISWDFLSNYQELFLVKKLLLPPRPAGWTRSHPRPAGISCPISSSYF